MASAWQTGFPITFIASEKPTSILTMIQMKPSFMLVIWYYTDLKNLKKYEYYAKDNVEVYWVHFTGNNVTNLLRSYGLTDDKRVFYCGSGSEYQILFRENDQRTADVSEWIF